MRVKTVFFFLLFLSFVEKVHSQEKVYNCQFVNDNIVVDGQGNEKAWKNIRPVWFLPHNDEELRARSWFKAVWDNQYLYFCVRYKMTTSKLK